MKNRIASIAFLKRGFPVLVLVAGLAWAQGCATYQVRMPDDDPAVIKSEGKVMHAYLWGLFYDPQVMTAHCESRAINDVEIKRNYLHDLASVLTLGIWMPMEVHFRCRAPHGDVGPFPEAPR